MTDIGNKSIGNQMEIKANVKIAIRHFVLILKKLRLISALRYVFSSSPSAVLGRYPPPPRFPDLRDVRVTTALHCYRCVTTRKFLPSLDRAMNEMSTFGQISSSDVLS